MVMRGLRLGQRHMVAYPLLLPKPPLCPCRPGHRSAVRPAGGKLAFECLFQHMELLVQFGQLLALTRNLADGVQHGGVVAAAK